MEGKKFIQIMDECVDQQKLMKMLVMEMLMPKLEEFVASTDNAYDDMLVKGIKEFMEKVQL